MLRIVPTHAQSKFSTQVIVAIGSELNGVFFASTLMPTILRYCRLKRIIKQSSESSDSSDDLSSDSSSTEESNEDDQSIIVITSEIAPLRFNYNMELQSLKYFNYILLFYYISFKLLGFITILISCYASRTAHDILERESINPLWFSIFHTISSWNNLGITLNYQSLAGMINIPGIVLSTIFLNMTGNIMIPIVTRVLVFIFHRIFEKKSSSASRQQPLLYILKAPTRMSMYFFSSTQTKLLFLVQLFLILLQMITFTLFYNKNDISPTYVGFAHSSFTRTAGFTLVDVRTLSPPVVMTYILGMYIAAYPVVILRQLRDAEVNLNSGFLQMPSNVQTIMKYVQSLFFSHIMFAHMARHRSTHEQMGLHVLPHRHDHLHLPPLRHGRQPLHRHHLRGDERLRHSRDVTRLPDCAQRKLQLRPFCEGAAVYLYIDDSWAA